MECIFHILEDKKKWMNQIVDLSQKFKSVLKLSMRCSTMQGFLLLFEVT